MSNASVSKDCFCSNTKILVNNYNAVPPKAPTFANTLIRGTQSIIKSETQTKIIKEDTKTNEAVTPPGSGRSRVPGEMYFPPRGINHYRKTLQCPFPDVLNCNPNSNVVEVYKDPYALCEPLYRYDKVIKAKNNSKGGNMDLFGNVLKNQTVPNQYYSVSYQGYLNYKKCKFPISKEDAIKPNNFSIKLKIDTLPSETVSQVTITIPLKNDSITRGLLFQPNNKITFVTDIYDDFTLDAIIENVSFITGNKVVLTLKNQVTLSGGSGATNYFIEMKGNPLLRAENVIYQEGSTGSNEITSIKYVTNNYPNANLKVGDSYKMIYVSEIVYINNTILLVNVLEFTIKTITFDNQFTVITLVIPIQLGTDGPYLGEEAVLTQISLENIISQNKCYTVVSNNPSYCGNLVTYDGATYPNRTFRDVAAVDSSAQVARSRYKNISNSIKKSPNKDFGISKCGNYIGGQAEYRNIQKKSTICSEAYALSKIRQNNKFICPPIIKEESSVIKDIIDTGVVVCIGIPAAQPDDADGGDAGLGTVGGGGGDAGLVATPIVGGGDAGLGTGPVFTTIDVGLGTVGGGGEAGESFSTGTDNLIGTQGTGGNPCFEGVFTECIVPRPIEFWKEFFLQYGDNLFVIEHLEIKSVKKGQNTSDILNEIFGERLYAIKYSFRYNVIVEGDFILTDEFSTLIEFKNLVSVNKIELAGNNYGNFKGIAFDNLIYTAFINCSFGDGANTLYINNTKTPILFSFENLKQIQCSANVSLRLSTTIVNPIKISKGIIMNIPNVIFIGSSLTLGVSLLEEPGGSLDLPFIQLINEKIKNINDSLNIYPLKLKTNSNQIGVIEFPALERIGSIEELVGSFGEPIQSGYLNIQNNQTNPPDNFATDVTQLLFPKLKEIREDLTIYGLTKLTMMRFPKLELIPNFSFLYNLIFSFNEPNMRISMPSMNNSCIPGFYIVADNAENDKVYPTRCFILYVIGGISYNKNTNSVNLNVSNNNESNIYKLTFNLITNTFEIEGKNAQETSFISGGLFYHNVFSFPSSTVADDMGVGGASERTIIISGGLHCTKPPYGTGPNNPVIDCYSGCQKDYENPQGCSFVEPVVYSAQFWFQYGYIGTELNFELEPRVGSKAIINEENTPEGNKSFVYFFGGGNYNTSTTSGLDLLTNNNGTFSTFDINIIRYKQGVFNKDGDYDGKMNFLSSVPGFTTNELWNFAINKSNAGKAMIIGGVTYDSNTKVYTTLNTVAKYDFTTKLWTAAKLLNRQREHPMCVQYVPDPVNNPDGVYYVIGGKDRNASVQILSGLEFSTDNAETWTLRQDIPLNIARCNAVCEIIGTYIYVIGGEGEPPNYSLDSIERLNLENIDGGWELLEQTFPYDFTGGAGILV